MFYYGMYCGYNGTCNFSYLEVYGQSMQVHGAPPLNVALVSVNQGKFHAKSTTKIQSRYQWTIEKLFDIIASTELKLSFYKS